MENKSGIWPVGHRVLVKPFELEEATESGIIVRTAQQKDREQLAQMKGIVVAIGTTAYSDQPAAWCKVGDTITFGKFCGLIYKDDETEDHEEYRVINDLDVVAVHLYKKESK
jgi:chaperonin GroES